MIAPVAASMGSSTSFSEGAAISASLRHEYRIKGDKLLKETKEKFEKESLSTETRLIFDEEPDEYINRVC